MAQPGFGPGVLALHTTCSLSKPQPPGLASPLRGCGSARHWVHCPSPRMADGQAEEIGLAREKVNEITQF